MLSIVSKVISVSSSKISQGINLYKFFFVQVLWKSERPISTPDKLWVLYIWDMCQDTLHGAGLIAP